MFEISLSSFLPSSDLPFQAPVVYFDWNLLVQKPSKKIHQIYLLFTSIIVLNGTKEIK